MSLRISFMLSLERAEGIGVNWRTVNRVLRCCIKIEKQKRNKKVLQHLVSPVHKKCLFWAHWNIEDKCLKVPDFIRYKKVRFKELYSYSTFGWKARLVFDLWKLHEHVSDKPNSEVFLLDGDFICKCKALVAMARSVGYRRETNNLFPAWLMNSSTITV